MATRSLTDVFTLMRNNAIQNRTSYNDQMNDRSPLVEHSLDFHNESSVPPAWTDEHKECQYALLRLNDKIQDLDNLHKKLMHRPSMDDSLEDQHQIEMLTRDITKMFVTCHKLVESIKRQSNFGSVTEKRVAQNAMASLVASLQNASNCFRKTQNAYLKTLNLREERSKEYFHSALVQEFDSWEVDNELNNIDRVFGMEPSQAQAMSQTQLLLLEEDNTRMAAEREAEVKQIVKSIVDLNEIFKDLAHMVTEQGTILDRIDYTIERTSMQVHQGFQQLQKAEGYQKKNRKMTFILGLSVVTIFMFILLVAVKFN